MSEQPQVETFVEGILSLETPDVLWRTDTEFCITYISPSDERLRGYKAEEVVGQGVFKLFTEEGIAIVTEALNKRHKAKREGNPLGIVKFEAPHRCFEAEADCQQTHWTPWRLDVSRPG